MDSMISELQPWIYPLMFGLISLLVIGNNLWHLVVSKRRGESCSFTLFIGAVAGVIAVLTSPLPVWCAVIPLLIDPGAAYSVIRLIKSE